MKDIYFRDMDEHALRVFALNHYTGEMHVKVFGDMHARVDNPVQALQALARYANALLAFRTSSEDIPHHVRQQLAYACYWAYHHFWRCAGREGAGKYPILFGLRARPTGMRTYHEESVSLMQVPEVYADAGA
jgi:hypothetical protein